MPENKLIEVEELSDHQAEPILDEDDETIAQQLFGDIELPVQFNDQPNKFSNAAPIQEETKENEVTEEVHDEEIKTTDDSVMMATFKANQQQQLSED